jgi:hypothetical protein
MRSYRIALVPLVALGAACMPDVSGQIQQANQMVQQAQAAAQPRVTGTLQINSAPFPIMRCMSGQLTGFNGIDVMGSDASRVRLVSEVDGTTTAIYFAPAGVATSMKSCGAVQVQPTGITINGVRVVQGSAQLDCTKDTLHVAGNFTFQCSQ